MEPEHTPVAETQPVETKPTSPVHTVTPLSKYLAMALFIVLPFIGGWIGYNYAPTKVVEIERVVVETESEPVIPTPDMASLPAPTDSSAEEVASDPFNPNDLILNPSIFADDMQNSSVCLNEWDEVQVSLPAAVSNEVKSMNLRVIAEAPPPRFVQIRSFNPYTVSPNETASYSYRWRVGEGDISNKIVPDELYRYSLVLYFDDPDSTYYTSRSVETEPFVVRDCGTAG